MVRRLTTSGAGVEVVVGRAGTGKTFALDAARQIWQDATGALLGQLDDHRQGSVLWHLAQLCHGDIDDALTAYRPPHPGWAVTAGDADVLRERLVAAWWDTVDRLGSRPRG